MIKNVIRHDDKIYIIDRELPASTSEEQASRIHNALGTDALLRNQQGNWFCCKVAKEVQFRDINPNDSHVIPTEIDYEDYGHSGFELQDNGGLG